MEGKPFNRFREPLGGQGSNNPESWEDVIELFGTFSQVIREDFAPGLNVTVKAAEKATAILYCTTVIAKRGNIEYQFMQKVSQAKGGSFGAKLLHWSMNQLDIEVVNPVKIAWSRFHQDMCNSIEVMLRELSPVGSHITVDQVTAWIDSRGGIGKLSMEYLNIRREENRKAETNRQFGVQSRRKAEAAEAGFDDVDAFESYSTKQAQADREKKIRAKFDSIRKRLVKNGSMIVTPEEGVLVIYSKGKLYRISDEDEYSLLSCMASIT